MSDIVVDPVRRQRYRFSRDGGDLIAEVETEPGGDVPEHIHPYQTEWWEIMTGDVTFIIDGRRQRAVAGDEVRADPGVRHAFVNDGTVPATLKVRISPAGELHDFLTEAARLASNGAFNQRGIPSSPQAALRMTKLVLRYRRDIRVTAPPPARVINLIARLLPNDRSPRATTT